MKPKGISKYIGANWWNRQCPTHCNLGKPVIQDGLKYQLVMKSEPFNNKAFERFTSRLP